jgi:hypothetical protein
VKPKTTLTVVIDIPRLKNRLLCSARCQFAIRWFPHRCGLFETRGAPTELQSDGSGLLRCPRCLAAEN